jgi:hypothetical protein
MSKKFVLPKETQEWLDGQAVTGDTTIPDGAEEKTKGDHHVRN